MAWKGFKHCFYRIIINVKASPPGLALLLLSKYFSLGKLFLSGLDRDKKLFSVAILV